MTPKNVQLYYQMDSNKNAIQLKYYVDKVFLFIYDRIALNRNRTLCYDVSLSDTY